MGRLSFNIDKKQKKLRITPSVEGRTITDYKGVVFGEVVAGVNFIRDF